ncbi:MAG: DUF502 domain-containing protein [Planctomycetota bacterium]|nr:MAG: DUF502 domain-containing protein [Planctomycetota bacterium]
MIRPGDRPPAAVKPRSTAGRLFLRGLALVLPLLLTLAALIWVWRFLSGTVFTHVDAFVRWVVELIVRGTSNGVPSDDISRLIEETVPEPVRLGISVAVSALLVLLVGWWFSGFLGRRVIAFLERGLNRLPLVGAIYPHIKQVVDFFLGADERELPFDRVVALPYPRRGLWSIGFLTGGSIDRLNRATGTETVSVFIPSSPMPMTGYTIFAPVDDLVLLDLSVDEALRMVVSGGVLVPPAQAARLEPRIAELVAGRGPTQEKEEVE